MNGALTLPPQRRRRRLVGLTPMIDVVFLLLVFFMLVARFTLETSIALTPAGGAGAALEGPPRIVRIGPREVRLNGAPIALEALAPAIAALSPTPDAAIVLQVEDGARTQRLIDVLDALDDPALGPALLME